MKQLLLVTIAMLAALHSQAENRQTTSLNMGWTFSYDSLFTNARQVDVPHDFQIEQPWVAPSADEKADNTDVAANIKSRLSARGFKEMGIGWYRRTINYQPASNTRTLRDFEGIMLVGDGYLNGRRIGGTDYGYVGFEIDVTNLL
ncbi:MAG: beta-galactosidase, partial [Prevotella sp.]|nr:beta-galactosidase [Prevotella sp.]